MKEELEKAIMLLKSIKKDDKKAKYDSEEVAAARNRILEAAQNSDIDAIRFLASSFYYGRHGYPEDDALAVSWYKKAADLGDVMAQYNTALIYETSKLKNVSLAFQYYHKAANQGHKAAIFKVAQMYAMGVGAPLNFEASFTWLLKYLAQGGLLAEILKVVKEHFPVRTIEPTKFYLDYNSLESFYLDERNKEDLDFLEFTSGEVHFESANSKEVRLDQSAKYHYLKLALKHYKKLLEMPKRYDQVFMECFFKSLDRIKFINIVEEEHTCSGQQTALRNETKVKREKEATKKPNNDVENKLIQDLSFSSGCLDKEALDTYVDYILHKICQHPDVYSLVQKVLNKGPVEIVFDRIEEIGHPAVWKIITRKICISVTKNDRLFRLKHQVLSSVIFEFLNADNEFLLNASSNMKFPFMTDLELWDSQGHLKLSLESHIKKIITDYEHLEWKYTVLRHQEMMQEGVNRYGWEERFLCKENGDFSEYLKKAQEGDVLHNGRSHFDALLSQILKIYHRYYLIIFEKLRFQHNLKKKILPALYSENEVHPTIRDNIAMLKMFEKVLAVINDLLECLDKKAEAFLSIMQQRKEKNTVPIDNLFKSYFEILEEIMAIPNISPETLKMVVETFDEFINLESDNTHYLVMAQKYLRLLDFLKYKITYEKFVGVTKTQVLKQSIIMQLEQAKIRHLINFSHERQVTLLQLLQKAQPYDDSDEQEEGQKPLAWEEQSWIERLKKEYSMENLPARFWQQHGEKVLAEWNNLDKEVAEAFQSVFQKIQDDTVNPKAKALWTPLKEKMCEHVKKGRPITHAACLLFKGFFMRQ